MDTVQFPQMRATVLSALEALADPEYQQRVWLERRFPQERFYDDLDENIHALYDDCVVLPDPRDRIGTILIDDEEAAALVNLGRVLTPLIDDLGDASDSVYVGDARWSSVVAAARAAFAALARNP
ncbi:hypothetical protein [Nocardia sp. NPDC058705]|uniref:SCO4402 family protein n=1 Tax=Nocardia sp. NPDC058705 TaxID=3346609 RepID=UPI0036CDA544